MKILVCIKQVPSVESELVLDRQKKWLSHDFPMEYRMNRFDEFAVEEALQLKSKFTGTTVHVISVGPERVTQAIQRAMGMGADHGIHIDFPEEGLMDPRIIATLIGRVAAELKYDLIFTGIMAEDDMHCMVGPLLAAYLDLPCAVSVVGTEIAQAKDMITATTELEGGRHQNIQITLPALITIQSGINRPRYPSLSNILRTRKQPLQVIETGSLSLPNALLETVDLDLPRRRGNIQFIEGAIHEKADQLLNILFKKGILK